MIATSNKIFTMIFVKYSTRVVSKVEINKISKRYYPGGNAGKDLIRKTGNAIPPADSSNPNNNNQNMIAKNNTPKSFEDALMEKAAKTAHLPEEESSSTPPVIEGIVSKTLSNRTQRLEEIKIKSNTDLAAAVKNQQTFQNMIEKSMPMDNTSSQEISRKACTMASAEYIQSPPDCETTTQLDTTNFRDVKITNDQNQGVVGEHKKALVFKLREEMKVKIEKIIQNQYPFIEKYLSQFIEALSTYKTLEEAREIINQLSDSPYMKEALDLVIYWRRDDVVLHPKQKNICDSLNKIYKQLEIIYTEELDKKDIVSNNYKFIKYYIDMIKDTEIKGWCRTLFEQKDWQNLLELKQQCELFFNLQMYLEHNILCDKDLKALGLVLKVIRLEKNQPVLEREYYEMMYSKPENYGINFRSVEINPLVILDQTKRQDFYVLKFEKFPNAFLELAENSHYIVLYPAYNNGIAEYYLGIIYYTSAENKYKISNHQIFPESGSNKEQYITIFDPLRYFTKEQVEKELFKENAKKATLYTKELNENQVLKSEILFSTLQENIHLLSVGKVQEPYIMTSDNFKTLLQEVCKNEHQKLTESYIKYQGLSHYKLKEYLKAKNEKKQAEIIMDKRTFFLNSFLTKEKNILKQITQIEEIIKKNERLEEDLEKKQKMENYLMNAKEYKKKKEEEDVQRRARGVFTNEEKRQQLMEKIKNAKNKHE